MTKYDNAPVYKGYRIHISQLFSATYVAMIVRLGDRIPVTTSSLTDTVTRVPGEHANEEQAIQAARGYIDMATKQAVK